MSNNRKCFCRWDECEDYRNQILLKAPSTHPWSGEMIRLRSTANKNNEFSDKATALRVPVRKHLLDNDPNYRIADQLHIYPHHYPFAILQWRNENPHVRINTILTKNDASQIALNDFGNNRFVEYTNSLYYMLNQSSIKKVWGEEIITYNSKHSYIQSPMTTRNEIRGFFR